MVVSNFLINLFLILLFLCIALSSLAVIFNRNAIYSIFYLVLVFLLTVIVLFIYNIYFLGLVLIIVYVGAIAVLFLFVLMMLNVKQIEYTEHFSKFFPISLSILLILLYQLITLSRYVVVALKTPILHENLDWASNVYGELLLDKDLYNISYILYDYYSLYFILCSFILLVGMVGAIALTLNNLVVVKRQDLYKQLKSDILNNVHLIKV